MDGESRGISRAVLSLSHGCSRSSVTVILWAGSTFNKLKLQNNECSDQNANNAHGGCKGNLTKAYDGNGTNKCTRRAECISVHFSAVLWPVICVTVLWPVVCVCHSFIVVSSTIGTLRNRTAGRLRTTEWRKNVARDCAFPVLSDIFSLFCRPESSSRPLASGPYCRQHHNETGRNTNLCMKVFSSQRNCVAASEGKW